MKIVVDASFLTHRAGPGRYLRGLLPELVRLGQEHDFTLLAGPDGRLFEADNLKWLPIKRGTGGQASRLIWREIALPWIARREKADVVFSPIFFSPAIRKPAALVLTVLDMIHEMYPDTLPRTRRTYFGRLVRRCARRADHILTLSESRRRDIAERMGIAPHRITATLLAAGPQFDREAGLERLDEVRNRYDLSGSYLLYMGTFEPRKNLASLLEAYRLLLDRGSAIPLVLAGEYGWGGDDPRRWVEALGLAEHVIFTGYVDDRDQAGVYAGARMLIFPSLYEGFGLPLLEAMACGTPVIASNAASIPEVVGDAGILVEPLDTKAIADAMASILEDPDKERTLRARGLERAKQFTWERTARLTLDALESVGNKE